LYLGKEEYNNNPVEIFLSFTIKHQENVKYTAEVVSLIFNTEAHKRTSSKTVAGSSKLLKADFCLHA